MTRNGPRADEFQVILNGHTIYLRKRVTLLSSETQQKFCSSTQLSTSAVEQQQFSYELLTNLTFKHLCQFVPSLPSPDLFLPFPPASYITEAEMK